MFTNGMTGIVYSLTKLKKLLKVCIKRYRLTYTCNKDSLRSQISISNARLLKKILIKP